MMKKGLLSLSFFVSLLGGVNSYAQTVSFQDADDGKTLEISGFGDLTSNSTSIVSSIREKLTAQSAYTKVVFKNTGTDACKIDDKIVKAILFTGDYAANQTLETVDLGEATVEDLGIGTFVNGTDQAYILNDEKLSTLTLPLTKKDADGGMTLPSYTICYSTGQGWGAQWTASKNGYINFIVPTGYTKIAANAFRGASKTKHITLPEGITEIGDDAFRLCSILEEINFPSTVEKIGKFAFKACAGITEVNFPKSLKTIECGAFSTLSTLKKIKFNEGLEYIGNAAFYCASQVSDQTTLVIPASVKYIGPGAFLFREFQDIYYLGDRAPAEPMGVSGDPEVTFSTGEATAFANNIYMGNNGFNPSEGTEGAVGTAGDISGNGEGNRQNYANQTTYFCVLHFRGDLTKDQMETFTDITRHYQATGLNSTNGWSVSYNYDNVGKETTEMTYSGVTANKTVTTGYIDTYNGKQYTWPSQAQFMRSYVVNTYGYKWDGITKYKYTTETALTQEQKNWIANDPGIKGYTNTDEKKGAGTLLNTISDCSNLTDEDYYLLAYLGTRRHVFIAMDAGSSVDYNVDIAAQKWQTICLPCNLTKKQVTDIFGDGSQVCLFSKVVRSKEEGDKKLHLYFQNDTYRNKYTKQSDGSWTKDETAEVGDNDVVITAHEAYMIYATKNPEGGKYVIANYEPVAGSPLPTVISANASDETTDADHTKYSFIGNFMTKGNIPDETTGEFANITVPQYSYFYAAKNGGKAKFWFYEGKTYAWKAGKCVVERYELRNADNDKKELFTASENGSAKQVSVFGNDTFGDETTGMEQVEFIMGSDATATIYNLNGEAVGNSRANLVKGVYIQNGKKFVVK